MNPILLTPKVLLFNDLLMPGLRLGMYKAVLWQGNLSVECCLMVLNMKRLAIFLTGLAEKEPWGGAWGAVALSRQYMARV